MTNVIAVDTRRTLTDPRFMSLVAARARLRWGLSFVVLAMFFGLISLMSFAPTVLALPLGAAGATIGLSLAFAMFVGMVVVTGFYVHRSGSRFDNLMQSVRDEAAR